jgi:transposase InsO family protein
MAIRELYSSPSGASDLASGCLVYINLAATSYYLCSVLDGYSRSIVHWDLRESMKEAEIERILERAKEKYPEAKPRIISDNGPQFIARDFKEFIRISGIPTCAPRRFIRSRTKNWNAGTNPLKANAFGRSRR